MTFRFIDEHREQWPVRLRCETLEVSPAGYYAWRGRPASAQEQRRQTLLVEIRAVHAEVKARYGSPRIHAELVARGQDCCVNTVAQLMRENGIAAKTARKFRCTTDSNHDRPVADNLLGRHFDPASPNASWVADITYIPTREGWLYLAVVEDLPLSRGVMLQPLSDPLPVGLRLLPPPLPAIPSACLAARFPLREDYGLTTLRRRTLRGLGAASTPVARHLRRGSSEPPVLATHLLVQA